MHCCWKKISKQFRKLWMDSKNHKKSWYIGDADTVAKINKHLKDIYVPTEIEAPIPIQKGIRWKDNNNFSFYLLESYSMEILDNLL
jgi:hypothetical protein